MAIKHSYILKYLALALFCCSVLNVYSQKKSGVHTIVIDPGHGGRQWGATVPLQSHKPRLMEKDINLAVSLKFGALVEEWFPDVKVLYTRKDDSFVDFHERSDLANKNNADLFISIHANSEETLTASGSETYIMGLHTSEENLKVAMYENSFMTDEENYQEKYDGFDPTDDSSYVIMFSFLQGVYLEKSLRMAEFIQEEFQNGPIKRDRGVKQAGFYVLFKTATPSVLIELGYMSNPTEEKILTDPNCQQEMAECIFRAFKKYKQITDEDAYNSLQE